MLKDINIYIKISNLINNLEPYTNDVFSEIKAMTQKRLH